jgi:hypothetical protein
VLQRDLDVDCNHNPCPNAVTRCRDRVCVVR